MLRIGRKTRLGSRCCHIQCAARRWDFEKSQRSALARARITAFPIIGQKPQNRLSCRFPINDGKLCCDFCRL